MKIHCHWTFHPVEQNVHWRSLRASTMTSYRPEHLTKNVNCHCKHKFGKEAKFVYRTNVNDNFQFKLILILNEISSSFIPGLFILVCALCAILFIAVLYWKLSSRNRGQITMQNDNNEKYL